MRSIFPRSFFKDRNHGPFFTAPATLGNPPSGWVKRTVKRPGDLVLTGGKFEVVS